MSQSSILDMESFHENFNQFYNHDIIQYEYKMKTLYHVIIVVTILLLIPLLTSNSANAGCLQNSDWPDAPCYGCVGCIPSMEKQREQWNPYYQYKGTNWMEMMKTQMIEAMKNGTLEDWVIANQSNYNVWRYYYLNDQAPFFRSSVSGLNDEHPYLPLPFQQLKTGISAQEVACKGNLQLVTRYQDLAPLCLKPAHLDSLLQRGAIFLLFVPDSQPKEIAIQGLKESYGIGQPISFTIQYGGNSPGCIYPRIFLTDSDRKIVWENPSVALQCNHDTGVKYREMKWQVGQDGTLHVDHDSGGYRLVVFWNNKTYTKEFAVNSLVSQILIPKGFSEKKTTFQPLSLTIKQGINDTVQWINYDTTDVSILADDARDFGFYDLTHFGNYSTIAPGKNINYTFWDYPKTILYHAESGQNGIITVLPRHLQFLQLQIQHPDSRLGENKYSNDMVAANRGTWVSWENIDNVTHTITSDDKIFDSGPIKPRMRFTLDTTSLQSGYYDYHDTLNPNLKGAIRIISFNETNDKSLIKKAESLDESKLFLGKHPDAVINVQHNYYDGVDFMVEWQLYSGSFESTRTLELEVSFDKNQNVQHTEIGCLGSVSTFNLDVIGSIKSDWCYKSGMK